MTIQKKKHNNNHKDIIMNISMPKFLEDKFSACFSKKLTARSLAESIIEIPQKNLLKNCKRINQFDTDYFIYMCIPDMKDRKNKIEKKLRVNCYFMEYLNNLTEKLGLKQKDDSLTPSILCNLIALLCYTKINECSTQTQFNNQTLDTPLFNLHGNKQWFREHFKNYITELPSNINTSIELFGGTGILTADIQHYAKEWTSVYNDDDKDKINFFTTLIKDPYKLMLRCNYYKKHKEMRYLLDGKSAESFWINNVSDNNERCQQGFYSASLLYKSVKFTNTDALKCLKKYMTNRNALILCDSPYIYTKG